MLTFRDCMQEEAVQAVICRLSDVCYKRGQPVKVRMPCREEGPKRQAVCKLITVHMSRDVLGFDGYYGGNNVPRWRKRCH